MNAAVSSIVGAVQQRLRTGLRPFLVAIDGASGAGKSTVAVMLAEALGAVVVPGDDFFSAEVTDDGWQHRTAAQRAADATDWRRLRADALEPLLAGQVARWKAFDFLSGARLDGSYGMLPEPVMLAPAEVIVLDGTYSSRPELLNLIDLSVLVKTSATERRRRLSARENKSFLERWHARWDPAEEHYFTKVRPPSSFDLIVDITSA